MGLRVNTNVAALRTLRLLNIHDKQQALSLERLSTGLSINRASDNPAGLVISEQLRSQIAGVQQASENAQNSGNVLATAEAALQEVSDLLIDIQDSVVFALNTGGASPSQIAAEQSTIDASVESIQKIAATTRFGDRGLLNGTNDFNVGAAPAATIPSQLNDLKVRSVQIPTGVSSTSVTVAFTTIPLRGSVGYTFNAAAEGVLAASTVIRISGPRGTEDIALPIVSAAAGGQPAQTIADAINAVAGNTGVFASGTTVAAGGTLRLFSEEFGSAQSVRVEVVAGALTGSAGDIVFLQDSTNTYVDSGLGVSQDVGEVVSDKGRDAIVTIDGQSFTGTGRFFKMTTSRVSMEFGLNPDAVLPASVTFSIANRGLTFQVGELPQPSDRLAVGIEGVTAGQLGQKTFRDRIAEAIAGVGTGAPSATAINKGGFLSSVRSGGANDLDTNSGNAQVIVNAAINQVSGLRGFLGAVQSQQVDSIKNVNDIRVENLTAALSDIRDLNFAAETTAFTRLQILFQAGIASLASANLIPQSVLTLLG